MNVERARSKVVDLSRPGRGEVAVEIAASEASEALMALCTLSGEEELDTYDMGIDELHRIQAGMRPELRAQMATLILRFEKVPAHLLGIVAELPPPRSFEALFDVLSDLDPFEIQLHLLGYYMRTHAEVAPEVIEGTARGDPEAAAAFLAAAEEYPDWHTTAGNLIRLGADRVKELLLEVLREFYEGVFRPLGADVMPRLEADIGPRRAAARELSLEELIQSATNGFQYTPEPGVRKIVLFPTYWLSPWVIALEHKAIKIFCYPVSAQSPSDPQHMSPTQLARFYKALGDEGRLKLLRRLSDGPLTLMEAATALGVAKSTAHHHLALLRQAGLVLIRDEDDKVYTLRTDLLPGAGEVLNAFLKASP